MEQIEQSFCPHCGEKQLIITDNKRYSCGACSHVYYQNTAAATAAMLYYGDKLLMTKRAKAPALGSLDLPGGFIDPNETAEEGLVRELKEELNLDLKTTDLRYWKSFNNIYPYKGMVYYTCDLVFESEISELPNELDKEEISSIECVDLISLDLSRVGLTSIRKALEMKIAQIKA